MSDTYEIMNARITGTMLGYEDHGILTCMIYTDHEHGCQGFGGYRLDQYDHKLKKAVGHAYGIAFIAEILKVVGVENWEDLKGKHCRVEASHCNIRRIGNIIEDKWFNPRELAEKYYTKEELGV